MTKSNTERQSSRLRQLLREPLVHFLAIGATFFAVFVALNDTPPVMNDNQTVISDEDVMRLARQFGATWMRAPTRDELDGLIGNYVQEEVLVRQALDLGLDRDDSVIRKRLRQKMDFLTESRARTAAPDETVLRAFFEANKDAYMTDPRLSFEQVFVGPEASEAQISEIRQVSADAAPPQNFGHSSMLPARVDGETRQAVDRNFGDGFFAAIAPDEGGQWQGPITSAYGAHFVRVLSYEASRLPEFDSVRGVVEQGWQQDETATVKDREYQRILGLYEIHLPDIDAMVRP